MAFFRHKHIELQAWTLFIQQRDQDVEMMFHDAFCANLVNDSH